MNIRRVVPFRWPMPSERTVSPLPRPLTIQGGIRNLLDEPDFNLLLIQEERRTGRSGMAVVLVLVTFTEQANAVSVETLVRIVSSCLRQTDCLGWYEADRVLGVLFTQIDMTGQHSTAELLRSRIASAVSRSTPALVGSQVSARSYSRPSMESESSGGGRRVCSGLGA